MYVCKCRYKINISNNRKKIETDWRITFVNNFGREVEAEDKGRSCSALNEFKLRSIKSNEINITNT